MPHSMMWCTVSKAIESPIALPEGLALELRRGALVLAALAALRTEQYGYSLKKSLAAAEVHVDEGTLYPLLRRLESQQLLSSRWVVEEGRPRRYYRDTELGLKTLEALNEEWERLSKAIRRVLK
jgi:PadR family transcriptional regulator, regulatory protein PadR